MTKVIKYFLKGFKWVNTIDDIFTGIYTHYLPKEYNINGSCKKRGICCEQIGIKINKNQYKIKTIRNLIIAWYEAIYNFKKTEEIKDKNIIKFKCQHLKEKKCSIYKTRPLMCRRYPMSPKSNILPEILPGCGYKITNKIN